MKPFPRPVLLLCLAALILGLGACAQCKPTHEDPARLRETIGDFGVFSPEPAAAESISPVYLSYKGKDISQISDPMRDVAATSPEANFPLPGCTSVSVSMFTGGANCCFGYYLLTHCPDSDYAGYIEPQGAVVEAAQPSMAAYTTFDPSFLYYSPAGQTGDKQLSLSRVESPRISRHLVFDSGTWRADRPGEFPAAYKALIGQLSQETRLNQTARAISAAYYSLMAGEQASTVSRTFTKALPREYAKLAPTVFADIQAAAAGFDPVRNLDIRK